MASSRIVCVSLMAQLWTISDHLHNVPKMERNSYNGTIRTVKKSLATFSRENLAGTITMSVITVRERIDRFSGK